MPEDRAPGSNGPGSDTAAAASAGPPPAPGAGTTAAGRPAPGARRRRPWIIAGAVLAAAAAAGVAAYLIAREEPVAPPPPPSLADAVPFDGRSPSEPAGEGTRVLVALPRPPLGATDITEPGAQRRYVRSLRDESRALRSALGARGIRLSDVATFERTWNGFAATVRTRDLADLDSLGVRVRPVRRFYPATAEPVTVPGVGAPRAPVAAGGLPVAVLASGADAQHPLLAGLLDAGWDAVERDDDPAPRDDPRGGRRETSGTVLAGVLAAAGERVLPIRVAALQPAAQGTGLEEVALSDQLLAGLERAVDPDGDGATDDHAGVALVGVSAPYAGFAQAAEAEAARSAAVLGTLVVAPAGQEGEGAGPSGTIGSPGAAPAALTVGALAAPAAVGRVELALGEIALPGAVLLGGAPPPDGLKTAAPLRARDAIPSRGPLRGRFAVVEAGNAPAVRAVAAAGAGARAVLLAEPRARRPLPAMPAGRLGVPVVGLTGAAARTALATAAGAAVAVDAAAPGRAFPAPAADAAPALSPFSSRGPSPAGDVKPDLAAPGAAFTAAPGGAGAVVGGTAIAAAAAAVEAARLARTRPDASAADLRAALIAAADGAAAPPARDAGAGVLRAPAPGAPLTAASRRRQDPCPGRRPCVRIVLANRTASDLTLDLGLLPDPGTQATVTPASVTVPAGGRREAEIDVRAGARGLAAGRLEARSGAQAVLVHPFAARLRRPPRPPLGRPALQRRGGRVTGVRFAAGAFALGDPLRRGTAVRLTDRLDLTLVDAGGGGAVAGGGGAVERLTPFQGARELLPAEYAYTLPAATLGDLGPGPYAFRAVARAPGGGRPAVAESRPFRP